MTAKLYASDVNGEYVFPSFLFLKKFDSLANVFLRRTFNDTEKADYITAVKCLQSQPAQKPMIQAARTRFDELQALHIYFAEGIHVVVR